MKFFLCFLVFYYSFIPGIEPTSIAPDLSSKGSKNVNQRIENLEWCGDPPEDIFGIQILSAFVEIAVVEDRTREEGDEIQSPSQKVQVEFNVKAKANPNIFVPNSKYSFDLWEEVTGTHDKIRKGDLCTYFSENGVSCREEGETLLEGSLVGSVPGYPSRYEAMFTAYGFNPSNQILDEIFCFLVKFEIRTNTEFVVSRGHQEEL